jgi:hypothetical protein
LQGRPPGAGWGRFSNNACHMGVITSAELWHNPLRQIGRQNDRKYRRIE